MSNKLKYKQQNSFVYVSKTKLFQSVVYIGRECSFLEDTYCIILLTLTNGKRRVLNKI